MGELLFRNRIRHNIPNSIYILLVIILLVFQGCGPGYYFNKAKKISDSQPDKALELYQKVLKKSPKTEIAAETLLAVGDIYFHKGKFDLAVGNYQELIEKYPKSSPTADALLKLNGLAIDKKSDYETGLRYLRKFAEDFPEDIRISDVSMKISEYESEISNRKKIENVLNEAKLKLGKESIWALWSEVKKSIVLSESIEFNEHANTRLKKFLDEIMLPYAEGLSFKDLTRDVKYLSTRDDFKFLEPLRSETRGMDEFERKEYEGKLPYLQEEVKKTIAYTTIKQADYLYEPPNSVINLMMLEACGKVRTQIPIINLNEYDFESYGFPIIINDCFYQKSLPEVNYEESLLLKIPVYYDEKVCFQEDLKILIPVKEENAKVWKDKNQGNLEISVLFHPIKYSEGIYILGKLENKYLVNILALRVSNSKNGEILYEGNNIENLKNYLTILNIPQVLTQAKESKTKDSLSNIRVAINNYYSATSGFFPMNLDNLPDTIGGQDVPAFIPNHMQEIPKARLRANLEDGTPSNSDSVTVVDTGKDLMTADTIKNLPLPRAGGWIYSSTTGEIRINCTVKDSREKIYYSCYGHEAE